MATLKHACMLPKPPSYDQLHPTASCWQRIRNRWRNLLLPCDWHHGTLLFFRSHKSLDLERQRQLATSRWFVWHPYSPASFYFDCLMWTVHFCAAFYVPVQVFRNCPNPADPFILATDILTLCSVVVMFCTGYNDAGSKEIILEPKKIALHYIKTGFILDFASSLPLQLYQPFSDCRYPSHTVFFPLKLLRSRIILKSRKSLIEQFEVSYSYAVTISVTFRLLNFFNWMAYWQYQVPALCVHYYDLSNLGEAEGTWLKRLKVDTTTNPFVKYVTNLYYVCGRCLGAGYAPPVTYHVMPEMIQNCITDTVSLVFLIYCFMTVVHLVLCSQNPHFVFDGAMKDLDKYMAIKRLPKSLQHKIRLFINYKFGGSYMDEKAIMNTINDQMKQDINMHTCRRLVATVPLFKGFPIALINTLIFNLKQEVYIPEQEVIKRGQKMDSMYFIYYGTVAILNEFGVEVKHLNDGACFGEAAVLNPEEPAPATITALEITEIYVLTYDDFKACIQHYPLILERMNENRLHSSREFSGRP